MATDKKLPRLIINKMNQEQFETVTPSEDELYLVEDKYSTWVGTKDEYEELLGKGDSYYAWSSLSGTYDYIYTLKEIPNVGDDIYYNNEVIGTVDGVPSDTTIRTSTASVCTRATSKDIIPKKSIDNNTLYNVINYGLFLGEEKITASIQDVSNKLDKSGDTMTGELTTVGLNVNSTGIGVNRPEIIKGVIPEANKCWGFTFNDSSNADTWQDKRLAVLEANVKTDGSTGIIIGTYKNEAGSSTFAGFSFGWSANGRKTYSPSQLITTYVSGTSGYNIWSNGYCEQWGSYTNNGTANVTITFAKTFSNTNYNLSLTHKRTTTSTGPAIKELGYQTKTTKTFTKISATSTGYEAGFDWRACGYLASDQY